jgi:hypothetical protein
MSFNAGLNPNVVKTALDKVVFQSFDADPGPQVARASDPDVFHQSSADSAAVIMEVFKGVPLWSTRQEEQDVPQSTPRTGHQVTFNVLNYANSVDISKNLFDDDQHDVVSNMMREFGEKARLSQDNNAMALFRGAFGVTNTADGADLISDSHTNLNGDTVDNKLTAALAVASLESAIVALMEQKDQAGVVRGHMPKVLLVPPALFKEAVEITESELISDSADNAINWLSAKYGLKVKQSPYLGAAAGGSDTAWFLLGGNHQIYRWTRQPLKTDLVDYKFQRNNNYIYKGEFREKLGAVTYEGIVGSDGSV